MPPAGEKRRPSKLATRALLLGLDGATFDVIDRLGERLPNLRYLSRHGFRAPLRSTTPPMTLPSWSSIITGVGPGQHGIYDFVRRKAGGYRIEFQHAGHRRVPTIFRHLSDRGHRVASIAMPTTWPPEAIDGVMVSGFDSPVATAAEAAHCRPRALWDEIERRFGGMAFADFQEGDTSGDWHARALQKLLREIARKEAICRWLLDREDWTLFSVVFGESDTVSHHFWAYGDPASPRYMPGIADAIARVYERLDWAVGELAARADFACVASDHGFGGAGDLAIYINRYLEGQGLLVYRAGAIGAGAGLSGAGDRLRALAMRLPVEKVVRRLPGALLGQAESLARYGNIDFGATQAWSDEMNYAATVHLNRTGRDPRGLPVDEGAVVAALVAWEVEGQRVVDRVHRADELWGTDRAPGAPDLVLDLALRGGYSVTVLPSSRVPRGTTWRRLEPAEYAGGKGSGMNGSHRQHGVFLLGGVPAQQAEEAGVADVTPTLLACLGQPVPAHVTGRSWVDESVPRVTVSTGATEAPPLDTAQSEALSRRLTALGYF